MEHADAHIGAMNALRFERGRHHIWYVLRLGALPSPASLSTKEEAEELHCLHSTKSWNRARRPPLSGSRRGAAEEGQIGDCLYNSPAGGGEAEEGHSSQTSRLPLVAVGYEVFL